MSFKVILTLNGKDYKLVSCDVKFNQEIGKDGRPVSEVQGGKIDIVVVATEDTVFVEWMTSNTKTMDGEINFFSVEDEQVLRKLKFSNGYCVSYAQVYDETGSEGLSESITVSSKKIELGDAEHEKNWAK